MAAWYPGAAHEFSLRMTKKDGSLMHFDILVPGEVTNAETVYQFGRAYLQQKGQAGQKLTAKECRLCHTETASPGVIAAIQRQGYSILEMEGCA